MYVRIWGSSCFRLSWRYFFAPTNWQLSLMILPVNGQKQLSIGRTLQVEVTVWPVLSIAVQPEQWDNIPAFAGLISNVALSRIAARLPNNSIFFFLAFVTANPLSCPFGGGDLTVAAVVD
jgi:hypothetical protein